MGIRCADHVTPLYPQKLALTSPTGGGRSVGIVRSQTKATEFSFLVFFFSNDDIHDINSGKVKLNLVYKGQCVNTRAFKVRIENV